MNDQFSDGGKKDKMSNSESFNLKVINLERELGAMKKRRGNNDKFMCFKR